MSSKLILTVLSSLFISATLHAVDIAHTHPPAELLESLKIDLATRLKRPIDDVKVEDVRPMAWPDRSLGCPQPGILYGMAVTPGYVVQVNSGNDSYAYHTDEDKKFVLCNADESSSGGIRYEMRTDPKTKITFPWLKYYSERDTMLRVNERISQIMSGLRCEDEDVNESDFKVYADVSYAERDIFSVNATVLTYCGGSIPTDKSNMSITFDMTRGNEVKFQTLFQDYEKDKEKILGIIFSDKISEANMLQGSQDGDARSCGGNAALYSLENLLSSSFSYNFTVNGLQVQPEWPTRIAVCAQRVIVPYEKLRRFGWFRGMLARAR